LEANQSTTSATMRCPQDAVSKGRSATGTRSG
jgi:hypothetical protein